MHNIISNHCCPDSYNELQRAKVQPINLATIQLYTEETRDAAAN